MKCLSSPVPLVITATLFTGFASSAMAQDDFDDRVEEARQKGIQYLIDQQLSDGGWQYEKHRVGITALCTMALLENGLPVDHEVIQNGVDFVRLRAQGLEQTYDIALAILLLSNIGSRDDVDTIRGLAASLIAGQLTSGGWTYTCPKGNPAMLSNPRLMPERKGGSGDNSCTQFAVLGLWVASREGVDITGPMRGVASRFVNWQNEDGGWSYRLVGSGENANERQPSKPSMTFAGLFCLTVARATRIRELKQQEERDEDRGSTTTAAEPEGDEPAPENDEARTLMEFPVFERGLNRAATYAGGINRNAARYYLWSVERIGVMLGLEKIGNVDWFQKAATALLQAQKDDGSWEGGHGALADTSFAILILRKANLGSDITRLLEGDPEQPFLIVETDQRFDKLEEAIEAAPPGSTLRIEGDGPFTLSHVDLEKDLVLQAGHGYDPVFDYDVGYGKFGIRARPEKDETVRHMLGVKKGTLTLEGLRLQMDPPFTLEKFPWYGIVVDGGNLRMLNCTFTESKRRQISPVAFRKPGFVTIRNCLLSGSGNALDVWASGKQDVLVENSILYAEKGVSITLAKGSQPGTVELAVLKSTINCPEAVHARTLPATTVNVSFDSNVVKSDALATTFLTAPSKKDARSWTGGNNLYDVDNWLGAPGRPEQGVTDLDSWKAFWGAQEDKSDSRVFTFSRRRPLSAYSHSLKPQDWELSQRARSKGAYTLTIGPGRGFTRFRSSIHYNHWQADGQELVAEK